MDQERDYFWALLFLGCGAILAGLGLWTAVGAVVPTAVSVGNWVAILGGGLTAAGVATGARTMLAPARAK